MLRLLRPGWVFIALVEGSDTFDYLHYRSFIHNCLLRLHQLVTEYERICFSLELVVSGKLRS